MKLSIQIKSVFGRDLIYPRCTKSHLIANMLNVKTLSQSHITKLKQLGYYFENWQGVDHA